MEVGAEVGGRRDRQGARCGERSPGERSRRREVHQLRPGALETAQQRAGARQAEAHLAVDRDRAAGGAQLVAGVEARFARLARPDQLERAALAQVADRPLDRQRDAVQLGRKGLGDVGDSHRAWGSVHRRILAIAMPVQDVRTGPARESFRAVRARLRALEVDADQAQALGALAEGAQGEQQRHREKGAGDSPEPAPEQTARKTNTGRRRRRWPMIMRAQEVRLDAVQQRGTPPAGPASRRRCRTRRCRRAAAAA